VRPLAPPVGSICISVWVATLAFTSFIVRAGMVVAGVWGTRVSIQMEVVVVAEGRVDGKAVAMAQATTIEL